LESLTTLTCGEIRGRWEDASVGADQALATLPSHITELVLRESRHHPPANILQWFTCLHPGAIQSLTASNLPMSHPVEFKKFIDRFRALSEIEVLVFRHKTAAGVYMCYGQDNLIKCRLTAQFLEYIIIVPLRQLKHID
jgi:hypothetical protein